MNYLYLIKNLLNITLYNKYRHHIKIDRDLHKEVFYLYKILDQLIASLQRDITLDEFIFAATQKLGKTEYEHLLKIIRDADISDDLILEALKDLGNADKAYQLAQLSLDVSEGKRSVEELKSLVDSFETKSLAEENLFVSTDLEELYEHTAAKQGIRWRLASLNTSLGSLRQGDFGFIFARPESGKTTFLASEVSHFATQTERPILWFNNEEQGQKVMLRVIQATLGLTLPQLFSDLKKYKELYYELTRDNIKIIDSASIYKSHVQKYIQEFEPSLIVFDQLDKIKGFDKSSGSDRNDLRLGSIYVWARELAKEYCPVIGVSQADGSGEGKKWLTMDNVAEAKTSKQAEADWILGIGKTHEPGMEFIRYLNISKNKLQGDEDSDPSMRHGHIEVLIEPQIARYRDF